MAQIVSKVLVVDESRIVRASVVKRLAAQFGVREASDGEEAWHTLLTDRSVAAVITDLKTPVLSGYELIERIRASRVPRVRRMPVIALTGDDELRERARAGKVGASDFMPKNLRAVDALLRLDTLIELAQKSHVDAPTEAVQIRDAETGLSTRTYLVMQMEQMAAFAKRNRLSCALLLINASAEKPEGAAFLRANLASMVRTEDVAAQLNGNTFAILSMPHTLENTQGLILRVMHTVEATLGKLDGLLQFAVADVQEGATPDGVISQALLQLAPWDSKRFDLNASELALPSLDELLKRISGSSAGSLEPLRPALRAHAQPLLDWLSKS